MESKPPSLDKMAPAELRQAFQALTEQLDQIEAEITALRDGLAATGSQPQPAPARPLTLWLPSRWWAWMITAYRPTRPRAGST